MELKPTPKKEYNAIRPSKLSDQERIYQRYFKLNGCTRFFELKNKKSRYDSILTSGCTNGEEVDIIVEYKNRTELHSYTYRTSIIELQKYESLKYGSMLNDSPAIYLIEYADFILSWCIDFSQVMRIDWLGCPINNESSVQRDKDVYHLLFTDVAIVIDRNTYQKVDKNKFIEYYKSKRYEIFGDN